MADVTKPMIGSCSNPRCREAIPLDHPYFWCVKCGEPLPQDVVAALPKLQKSSVPPAAVTHRPNLAERAHNDSRLALEPHLQPNEELIEWAYGIKMHGCLFVVFLLLLGLLSTLIVWMLFGSEPGLVGIVVFWILLWAGLTAIGAKLKKDYILGLTDRRLLVARLKTPLLVRLDFKHAISVTPFELAALPPVRCKKGRYRIHIKLLQPTGGFDAAFPGARFGSNYDRAARIAKSLEARMQSPHA